MDAGTARVRRSGLIQQVQRVLPRSLSAASEQGGTGGHPWPLSPGGGARWLATRWWLVALVGATSAVTVCLLMAREAGFPLDDSWIHQDFARTLATTGRFAFQPGRGGAGSTSPLWVLALLPPHLLTHGQAPIWLLVGWSAALGAATLGGLSILTGATAADLARRAGGTDGVVRLAAMIGALATVAEWHLVWAAVSGMETDLFALLVMLLVWGAARRTRPLWLGLLAGVTLAVRPEGLLVDALVVAGAWWATIYQASRADDLTVDPLGRASPRRVWNMAASWSGAAPNEGLRRLRPWLRGWLGPFLTGMVVAVLPYFVWNIGTTGHIFPSTFYAKGAFYGTGETAGVVLGYVAQVGIVMVGSSPVLLVLAALACSQRLLRRTPGVRAVGGASQRFPLAAVLVIWPLLLVVAYGVHLPTVYQHGRYLMPALPAVLALAAAGAAPLLAAGRRSQLAVVGGMALLATSLFSVGRSAQIYGSNVRYIDDFQVNTARWLSMRTPVGSLVATHDVGAIGYFSHRPVVDMAGLVDPQVVPFVSNQDALEHYLARRHAAYVVMFVDWYPPPATLVRHLAHDEVYQARAGEFSNQPGSSFVVYRTGW